MSKRNKNWIKLFNEGPSSKKLQNWLNDDEEVIYQLFSTDFKYLGVKPVKMIPTYRYSELPDVLKENGVELFRNQLGGCVLIKTKKFSLKTLFPSLKNPKVSKVTLNISRIDKISVLKHFTLHNEETGIILANELNLFSKFVQEYLGLTENFTIGGRLNTTVEGKLGLLYRDGKDNKIREIPVKAQIEVDNFIESENLVIALEAKFASHGNKRSSFSLHQFILPTLLLKGKTNKRILNLLIEYGITDNFNIFFRFFLYEIDVIQDQIILNEYSLLAEKTYEIHFVE